MYFSFYFLFHLGCYFNFLSLLNLAFNLTFTLPRGTKFLREFIFADWRFFCVLRELIFAIRTDWFFLLGINAIFRK